MISFAERAINAASRKIASYRSVGVLREQMAGKVTCLLYHRIAPQDAFSWIENGGVPANSPHSFEQHLSFLKQLNARFFTLKDLANGDFPNADEVGIVLTFDDGFADNFRIAAPILQKYTARAVFFVTTGLIESSEFLWDHEICWYLQFETARQRASRILEDVLDRFITLDAIEWSIRHLLRPSQTRQLLDALKPHTKPAPTEALQELYCNWSDLRRAMRGGHEVASHTVSHFMRYGITSTDFAREICESKQILQEGLQTEITSFSYPFNAFSFTDADLCLQAGYKVVATVDPGRITQRTSLYDVPRRTVFRPHDSAREFRALLAQNCW
jgi:peptidoglycan/xylan/chitin deacetylase (PgdA/CDA1 family)